MFEGAASFAAAQAEVQSLLKAGRMHDAVAAGAALVRRFREEPESCAVLVEALLALGQTEQAETVLRDARTRFPQVAWLAIRLADLAASRRDWAAAVARWQEAGLPETDDPAMLRRYALAKAGAGDLAEALQLVTTPGRCDPLSPPLLLAWAELLLRLDRADEAIALWPNIVRSAEQLGSDFYALTAQLALRASAREAAALFAVLMAEPDPGHRAWRPALAAALAERGPNEPALPAVRAAIDPGGLAPVGYAGALACALAGVDSDADQLSDLIARGVADGRLGLLPWLLETAQPERALQLRVALRLYLNRHFADPSGFAAIPPKSVCALLLIARVVDSDSLQYFAELAAARFGRQANGGLARPEEVAGQVAHAAVDSSRLVPPPFHAALRKRLRVAVCLSGRLPSLQSASGLLQALQLHEQDGAIFAQVWRMTGATPKAPDRDAVRRRLPPRLAEAADKAAVQVGMEALRPLYPALLRGRPSVETVEESHLRTLLQTDQVAVLDESGPGFIKRSQAWKTRFIAQQAHAMAEASGQSFDLVMHVQADCGLAASAEIDWMELAEIVHAGPLLFADSPYRFERGQGFTVGGRFGLGSAGTMAVAAGSFALGDLVGSGRASVYGMDMDSAMEQALAMQLHLHGMAVETTPALHLDMPPEPDPTTATHALALLWQDIRARPPARHDRDLVRAAMADVIAAEAR